MTKKEVDIDEEIEKIARKTNINIKKSEYSFEKQIKRLDNDIDKIINNKINEFDDNKKTTQEYFELEVSHDTVDRYREKLKKI